MPWSLIQASLNLEEVVVDEAVPTGREPPPFLSEVVTDKGYHSNYIAKTLKSAQRRSALRDAIAPHQSGHPFVARKVYADRTCSALRRPALHVM